MLAKYLVVTSLILLLACVHTTQHAANNEPPTTAINSNTACKHDPKTLRCVQFIDNYDGDTLTVNIPDVHPLFGSKISVRVLGIDTAEMRGAKPCERQMATKAKDFVTTKLKGAKKIDLTNIGRDKYFRILADVMVDGQSLTQLILQSKLAYPYDGSTKARVDWCKPLAG